MKKGMNINNKEFLLSQFADDTTLWMVVKKHFMKVYRHLKICPFFGFKVYDEKTGSMDW